jgi:hypothetical protein
MARETISEYEKECEILEGKHDQTPSFSCGHTILKVKATLRFKYEFPTFVSLKRERERERERERKKERKKKKIKESTTI